MLVSYKWLNRYVDLSNLTPKELADNFRAKHRAVCYCAKRISG